MLNFIKQVDGPNRGFSIHRNTSGTVVIVALIVSESVCFVKRSYMSRKNNTIFRTRIVKVDRSILVGAAAIDCGGNVEMILDNGQFSQVVDPDKCVAFASASSW